MAVPMATTSNAARRKKTPFHVRLFQKQTTSMTHQALGLLRQFSPRAARLVSVLSGPGGGDSSEFTLALAAELARAGREAWLVDTGLGELARRLGCRPLMSWRPEQSLEIQPIRAGKNALLYAPGLLAGDARLAQAAAACRACDCLLLDGGRFSTAQAPVDPAGAQTLVVLLGAGDAEAGYALVKALAGRHSPAQVLLAGEAAEAVAQAADRFLGQSAMRPEAGKVLYQNGNKRPETSSDTLTFARNLTWVVSRIQQNDQPKVAHGGFGKGAEEVEQ